MSIPNYKHVFCDECGGIVAVWDDGHFICGKCGKRFMSSELTYDYIAINDKTGWMFPVVYREKDDILCQSKTQK